jgi:hypothetical protein
MFSTCSAVQYGLPVLYDVEHFQDFLSSCCHSFMTHIVDGHCVCREFKTSPSASDLISPVCMCKSDAAPHLPASDSHVVLFCDGSDRQCTVSSVVSQLLPGTRLTVLSSPSHCEQVLQGTTSQQAHGNLLISAAVLTSLGIPSTFQSSTQCSAITGLPLFKLFVQTGISLCEGETPACNMF